MIRAAGVVVLRPAAADTAGAPTGPPEVLVVHRPRYDDWSLPKGKLEAGEHPLVAAVREVAEETGVVALPGRFLVRTDYLDPTGRPKTVDWWLGSAAGEAPRLPDEEVDEQRWISVADAPGLLTHRLDTDLVAALGADVTTPEPALLLLRHAGARARKSWSESDHDRPLTTAGLAQATALVPLLRAFGPVRVLSSPALRCRQTVEPFLTASGGAVELLDELTEEVAGDRQVGALRDAAAARAGGPQVVCSHRPVLDLLLDDAAPAAPRSGTDQPLKTAEVAVLTGDYGQMIVDRYLI